MNCQHCGCEIKGKRSDAKYCSDRCRGKVWRATNDPRDETYTFRANRAEMGDRLVAKGHIPRELRNSKAAHEDALLQIIHENL